mmetsp:Transcript_33694/g.100031  ORF Transcript_33694/g.100031 Transcript_33694/m.100031 type:complete len:215 (-) Transcript_33694:19-663(-)
MMGRATSSLTRLLSSGVTSGIRSNGSAGGSVGGFRIVSTYTCPGGTGYWNAPFINSQFAFLSSSGARVVHGGSESMSKSSHTLGTQVGQMQLHTGPLTQPGQFASTCCSIDSHSKSWAWKRSAALVQIPSCSSTNLSAEVEPCRTTAAAARWHAAASSATRRNGRGSQGPRAKASPTDREGAICARLCGAPRHTAAPPLTASRHACFNRYGRAA